MTVKLKKTITYRTIQNFAEDLGERELNGEVNEEALRDQIYTIGVMAYRAIHDCKGVRPVSWHHPGINEPGRVYSPLLKMMVDERQWHKLHLNYLDAVNKGKRTRETA